MLLRVLLIDRSAERRDRLADSLRRSGLAVAGTRAATNMREALAEVVRGSIDLVLCDSDLPGNGGLRFVGAARERDPNVPIVMVHEGPRDDRLWEALYAGANGCVTHPFDPESLGIELRLLLGL